MKALWRSKHFQTLELDGFWAMRKNWSGGPYFARICLTQKLSGCVRYFQPSLPKKTVLTALAFLIPKAPIFFCLQTLSHATNGNPFSVEDFFQKKCRLTWSYLCITVTGSWKHYMVCPGRASRLDRISTARPANVVAFQLDNFASALLNIPWKVPRLGSP